MKAPLHGDVSLLLSNGGQVGADLEINLLIIYCAIEISITITLTSKYLLVTAPIYQSRSSTIYLTRPSQ
eukprot:COSAG05_NODE_21952_length_268_cov_0.609467_1_plen_68_part_10